MREAPLDELLSKLPSALALPIACWAVARAAEAMGATPRLVTPKSLRIDEAGGVRLGASEATVPFAYRPPEVTRGGKVDGPAAVFGLGVVLIEMVTGRSPFARGSDMETRVAVSEEAIAPLVGRVAQASRAVDEVVRRACAKAPADRFASPTELARALDAFLDSELLEVAAEDLAGAIRSALPAAAPAPAAKANAPAGDAKPLAAKGPDANAAAASAPVGKVQSERARMRAARDGGGLRRPVSAPPERIAAPTDAEENRLPAPKSLPPAGATGRAPAGGAELAAAELAAITLAKRPATAAERAAAGGLELAVDPDEERRRRAAQPLALPDPEREIDLSLPSTVGLPAAAPEPERAFELKGPPSLELRLASEPPALATIDAEPSREPSYNREPSYQRRQLPKLELDERAEPSYRRALPGDQDERRRADPGAAPPKPQRSDADEDDDVGTAWIKPVGIGLLALLGLAILYQFVVRPLVQMITSD